MDNTLLNFALEIGLFSLLGILYYFYQKRKILKYEENKTPLVMSFILQSCLSEKLDTAQPELDHVIEALDDFWNKNRHILLYLFLKLLLRLLNVHPTWRKWY